VANAEKSMEQAKRLGVIDASIEECQRIIAYERRRLEEMHAGEEITGTADTLLFGFGEILALLEHSQQQLWEGATL
jgi:hypothetical protein